MKEAALPPSLPPPRTLPSTGSGFCRRVLKTIGQGACAGEGPIRGRPDFCVYEGVSVIRFCFPAVWRCPDVFAVFGFFGFGLTVPGRKAELCGSPDLLPAVWPYAAFPDGNFPAAARLCADSVSVPIEKRAAAGKVPGGERFGERARLSRGALSPRSSPTGSSPTGSPPTGSSPTRSPPYKGGMLC